MKYVIIESFMQALGVEEGESFRPKTDPSHLYKFMGTELLKYSKEYGWSKADVTLEWLMENVKQIEWKPDIDEMFYTNIVYIVDFTVSVRTVPEFFMGTPSDIEQIQSGNYFRTEDEAEGFGAKIRLDLQATLNRLKDIKLDNNWLD